MLKFDTQTYFVINIDLLNLLFKFADDLLPSAETVTIWHEGGGETFDVGFLGKMNVGLPELEYVVI